MADDSLRSTPEHAAAALGGGTRASAGGEDEGEVRQPEAEEETHPQGARTLSARAHSKPL